MNMIDSYTCKEALQDGILFDICTINPKWSEGMLNFVTNNLMNKGYYDKKVNIPNLLDLLNQANQIVKKESENFRHFDIFFSGDIELPSGEQQKVFIVQNETGKFTIMLPADY